MAMLPQSSKVTSAMSSMVRWEAGGRRWSTCQGVESWMGSEVEIRCLVIFWELCRWTEGERWAVGAECRSFSGSLWLAGHVLVSIFSNNSKHYGEAAPWELCPCFKCWPAVSVRINVTLLIVCLCSYIACTLPWKAIIANVPMLYYFYPLDWLSEIIQLFSIVHFPMCCLEAKLI